MQCLVLLHDNKPAYFVDKWYRSIKLSPPRIRSTAGKGDGTMRDLSRLFYPRAIAVVGASDSMFKWGSYIFTNLLAAGFKGEVYPVTLTRDSVYGRKAYKSLMDIPGEVDLVFNTTPANKVMNVLRDCSAKGVRNIVMITSGFSETGEEGKRLEEEMVAYAHAHEMNIVGPNTMGMVNTACSIYATGSLVKPVRGGISIVAQSGNVGNQVMEWAEQQNIGIGKFVGSGNEGVLMCEDYLEYLSEDDDTNVILMYLEGIDNGRRFMEIAKRTTMKKPVIALKAGRTVGGARAAASHTGAMAGTYATYASALKQSGVILTTAPTQMLTLSAAFDALPLPRGNRVGVVTLGGGWGVITADECEEQGLALPPLPDDVFAKLDSMLPPFWSKGNPVDLVGQPDPVLFSESLRLMVSSDAFDAVIILGVIGATKFVVRVNQMVLDLGYGSQQEVDGLSAVFRKKQFDFLDTIIGFMEQYEKPIYPVALVTSPEDKMLYSRNGGKYKVAVYKTPEEAVFCLAHQYEYSRYLRQRS